MICWLSNVNAQFVLHCKVIDSESGKEIPYASIQIINSAYGTACDEKGKFVLRIGPEFYEDTLKVSCIGYSNAMLAIQALIKNSNEEFTIRLNPFIEYLDEVVIIGSRTSPKAFLEEAINAVPENFIQQPFNMEAYSKMTVQDSSKILYQIESVLLTYREGYISGAINISKILHKRETGTIPLPFHDYVKDDKEYFPYWPGYDIAIDMVGWETGYGVFNPKRFKKMHFRYAGVSTFNQDTLVAVEYSNRKKGIKETSKNTEVKYEGIIYIALNNLAIVRHSLKIGSIDHDMIYKNVKGHYFPYIIKVKRPVLHNSAITLVDEIYIKNIETDNVVSLEWEHGNWYPKGVPYDEAYWNSNYPLKKIE